MSSDLHLKPSCGGCGSITQLYGSQCMHVTLCIACGKRMAENRLKCYECGLPVLKLIRQYNVWPTPSNDKPYFIGRFVAGIPSFSKKKNTENKWMIRKDGLQGRHVTDALREKYRNKPWVLEDDMGQYHYYGQLEGAQYATYYLLVKQDKKFLAIPAGSWYNFNKVVQYKQLTLEEAEEKMKNRRKTADGYERWMMKAANNGPAAFGETEKFDDKDAGGATGRVQKKAAADDDEGNVSDKGEEDEEEVEARKNRLGLNKRNGGDDGEGRRGGDHDFDDDDIEKGDDWEHEEIFTDDDEAVGNDPEEREDLAPEVPAPPEIKQEEEDEDEDTNEEEGGLSKSGKELKKLLGKTGGLNDSDEDDDDDNEMDDDVGFSPVLAPKQKDAPKDEPIDSSPSKAAAGIARATPSTSKSTKSKRKSGSDDVKAADGTPAKKVKIENEPKPSAKDASSLASTSSGVLKEVQPSGPVTEDEIRAVLLRQPRVTTSDLVSKFKARLKIQKDKSAFADILKKISKIQKTNGSNFVVLRERTKD